MERVIKFLEWMQYINNIHISDTERMSVAIENIIKSSK